jgi:hypothetical protein
MCTRLDDPVRPDFWASITARQRLGVGAIVNELKCLTRRGLRELDAMPNWGDAAMLRIIVLVLCALACSTAAARGGVARGAVNAAPRAEEAGAYPRDERVAPVERYRARQDIADSDYLGAALDDDDGSDNGGNSSSSNSDGNGGGGSSYTGGSGGGSRGAANNVPFPAMSFSGTVHGSYGGGDGHDGDGCVYKGVMTDAQIATCKAASLAWMRRTRTK